MVFCFFCIKSAGTNNVPYQGGEAGLAKIGESLRLAVEVLEMERRTLPLMEFFRPNIQILYKCTDNAKGFTHSLFEMGILADQPDSKLFAEDQLHAAYDSVFKKSATEELLLAWYISRNVHLIGRTKTWLKQFFKERNIDRKAFLPANGYRSQISGDLISANDTFVKENCSFPVDEFFSSLQKMSSVRRIACKNVNILPPFYPPTNPLVLPNLEALEISMSNPDDPEALQTILYFLRKHTFGFSTLSTVEIYMAGELVIKFDATGMLRLGRFPEVTKAHHWLRGLRSRPTTLRNFSCFQQKLKWAKLRHFPGVQTININQCTIIVEKGFWNMLFGVKTRLSSLLREMTHLRTFIGDLADSDIKVDLVEVLEQNLKLNKLVLGRCPVTFPENSEKFLRERFRSTSILLFNCSIKGLEFPNGMDEAAEIDFESSYLTESSDKPSGFVFGGKTFSKDLSFFPIDAGQKFFELLSCEEGRFYYDQFQLEEFREGTCLRQGPEEPQEPLHIDKH